MIGNFKHRGLKRLYERGDRSGIRPDLVDAVERILTVLDAATIPQALDLPRYRLHQLKGGRNGIHSAYYAKFHEASKYADVTFEHSGRQGQAAGVGQAYGHGGDALRQGGVEGHGQARPGRVT